MERCRSFLFLLFIICMIAGLPDSRGEDRFKFDAAHSVALEFEIENGRLLTSLTNRKLIQNLVFKQLRYSVGQLNGIGAGPDLSTIKINLKDMHERPDGLYWVDYSARFFVAWPQEETIPKEMVLYFPTSSEEEFRSRFLSAYEVEYCIREDSVVTPRNHWYYFRPFKVGCPIKKVGERIDDRLAGLKATVYLSNKASEGKYPEYDRLWEDGKLTATVLFGKDFAMRDDPEDHGLIAYQSFLLTLEQNSSLLGQPKSLASDSSSVARERKLSFQTSLGEIEINAFLIEGLHKVEWDEAFLERYKKLTSRSDVVIYAGHSAFGHNIERLARFAEFRPGRYQIYFINACDSFVYLSDTLQKAVKEANPGEAPSKYLDVVSNAGLSYFEDNAQAAFSFIASLGKASKSYNDLLADLPQVQRSVVTGEKDNLWQGAFD